MVESWPDSELCLANFTDLFIVPRLFDKNRDELFWSYCTISTLITGDTCINDIHDPLIETVRISFFFLKKLIPKHQWMLQIIDMAQHNVPISTSNVYEFVESLESLLIEILNYGFPNYDTAEWLDSLAQAEEVWAANTISDYVEFT